MKKVIAQALARMVEECFEGAAGIAYFTGETPGRTIFDTLKGLDASAASRQLSPVTYSVVSHTRHLLEAMRGSNRWAATGQFYADFEAAWVEQTADESRWDELRQELRAEYEQMRIWLSEDERLTHENLHWTLSILPHCAYHLGAIRQLALLSAHMP